MLAPVFPTVFYCSSWWRANCAHLRAHFPKHTFWGREKMCVNKSFGFPAAANCVRFH